MINLVGSGIQVVELNLDDLRLKLLCSDAVNYALVHNDISPVYGIEIENNGTQVDELKLEINVKTSTGEKVADPLMLKFPDIEEQSHTGYEITPRRWQFNHSAFAGLEESISATIEVAATISGNRTCEAMPLRLLARNEWWANSIPTSLAAFVRPNDRAVSKLLSDASDLLQTQTGDPSLQGYQASRERVIAITRAICEAFAARRIRYIDPPASFENTGQKIREHHEVLEERFGTCIDLSVAIAACLEQAGLFPVVFICNGHAFTGVITEEQHFKQATIDSPTEIVNWVDTGLILPIEATSLCDGRGATFEAAINEPIDRGFWSTRQGDLLCAIDVRNAHLNGVRPIPPATMRDGVLVVEVEKSGVAAPPNNHFEQSPQTTTQAPIEQSIQEQLPNEQLPNEQRGTTEKNYPPRIARWRNSLLDLSLRNPLINSGKKGIALCVPNGMLGRVEDIVYDGAELTLIAHDDLADIHQARGTRSANDLEIEHLARALETEKSIYCAVSSTAYGKNLRTLHRTAKTISEETGSNALFLTLGSLRWQPDESSDREILSPLFLLPIELRAQRRGPYRFHIEDGSYTVPNQCLMEKLKVSLNMKIPEFENPATDESGIDVPASIQAIRQAIINRGLPFAIEEEARLMILQFSTLELWQDMTENWQRFLQNPIVRHLVETPGETFVDSQDAPQVDVGAEADSYCPIPFDGSQLQAVQWATAGRSFVLQGPPGTGKSQTITNLITHALAHGKRVLFVAEKQAALDVVKRRLDSVGVGDLCLDLHGKDQSPAEVRAQLSRALNLSARGSTETWEQRQSRFRSVAASLTRYPEALHKTGPVGLSAWQARQAILAAGDVEFLEIPQEIVCQDLDTAQIYELCREIAKSMYSLPTSLRDDPWRLATDFNFESSSKRAELSNSIEALSNAAKALNDHPASQLLELASNNIHLTKIVDLTNQLREMVLVSGMPQPHPQQLVSASTADNYLTTQTELLAACRELVSDSTSLLAQFTPASVVQIDLDEALVQSRAADTKFFLARGKARKRVLDLFLKVRNADASEIDLKLLTSTIERLISTRARMREVVALANKINGLVIPQDWNPLDQNQHALIERQFAAMSEIRRIIDEVPETFEPIITLVSAIDASDTAQEFLNEWSRFCDLISANALSIDGWSAAADGSLLNRVRNASTSWLADAQRDFLNLNRSVRVTELLIALSDAGFQVIVDAITGEKITADLLESVARCSIARAVLRERLGAPGLLDFDGLQRELSVQDFIDSGKDLRGRMTAEIPAKVVRSRSFNASQRVGKVAELSKQLGRQRGGMKVRELLSNYGKIISELTPCLMMSPHSVARFLPIGAIDIDIVVFDEASQIRVEESISALARGRSVVVVGDTKQMPPTSVGRQLGDGNDDDLYDEEDRYLGAPPDMESILSEAVESGFEELWLSWHYRSQDESLIAFSNQRYYDERLSSFPAPPNRHEGLGITYRRVDGQFDRSQRRNINTVEANEIVTEVKKRLAQNPDASIGIITMNLQQMKLIDLLLDECGDQRVDAAKDRPTDKLFVKNLENVQGDEADTILFSLAFSPDPESGKMRLNFGPLTNIGGERRLNVAITRARCEVVIFCSFDPPHIDLARTASVGMAHLRAYLEMARGADARHGAMSYTSSFEDLHREDIVQELRQRGLIVKTDVGLSDFKVDIAVAQSEEGPWVAVLLDGDRYATLVTVGDREAVPLMILVGKMGWARVERVWLPSWIREREVVIERVIAATTLPPIDVEALETNLTNEDDQQKQVLLDSPMDDATDTETTPEQTTGSDPLHDGESFEQYRPVHEEVVRIDKTIFDRLAEAQVRNEVLKEIMQVLHQEAPITGPRLARVIAKRFDWSRLTPKRIEQILAVVPRDLVHESNLGTVVWVDEQQSKGFDGFRVPLPGSTRTAEDTPHPEVLNAMRWLCLTGHGVEREDLLRETASVLGVGKLGSKTRRRFTEILDHAIRSGELADEASVIVAPAKE